MPEPEVVEYRECPVHCWFELNYAQFLTVPRLVMQSMPLEWREQMAALLQEMDDTFDWRPKGGTYWVKLKGEDGRLRNPPDEMCDYRHGSVEHLRKCRPLTDAEYAQYSAAVASGPEPDAEPYARDLLQITFLASGPKIEFRR